MPSPQQTQPEINNLTVPIRGGKGNDTVDGGRGNDVLRGGDGFDKLAFDFEWGADTLVDFDPDNDVIHLLPRTEISSEAELDIIQSIGGVSISVSGSFQASIFVSGLLSEDLQFGEGGNVFFDYAF